MAQDVKEEQATESLSSWQSGLRFRGPTRLLSKRFSNTSRFVVSSKVWMNTIPTRDCDILMTFPRKTTDTTLMWLLARLRARTPQLCVHVRYHSNTGIYGFYLTASYENLLRAAEDMTLHKKIRSEYGGGLKEFVFEDQEYFEGVEDSTTFLNSQERQSIVRHMLHNLRATEDDQLGNIKFLDGQAIVPYLVSRGIIKQVLPLHHSEDLDHLKKSWVQAFFRKQPLDKVCDYFGVKIAMYFAYLGHYTKSLTFPAFVGFFFWIMASKNQYVEDVIFVVFALINIVWSTLYLESWKRRSAEFAYKWGTLDKEDELLVEPRPLFTGSLVESPVTGKLQPEYPSWKRNLFRYFVTAPIILACLSLVFYVMLMIFQLQDWINLNIKKGEFPFFFKFLPKILLALCIGIMDDIYKKIAYWLNDQENYRLEETYENQLIIKLASFQFVNSFLSLFYIAFYLQDMDRLQDQLAAIFITRQVIGNVKEAIIPFVIEKLKLYKIGYDMTAAMSPDTLERHMREMTGIDTRRRSGEAHPGKSRSAEGRSTDEGDEMEPLLVRGTPEEEIRHLMDMEKRLSLVQEDSPARDNSQASSSCQDTTDVKAAKDTEDTAETTREANSFKERDGSLSSDKSSSRGESEERSLEQESFSLEDVTFDNGQLASSGPTLTQAEVEATMKKYEDTFEDQLEMLVQFGYVTLFSSAFPMAAMCALLNNIIEIRSDAFKLCWSFQRPFGQQVQSIGTWQDALEFMSIIAVMVNCALVGFSGLADRLWPDMTTTQRIVFIVMLEHIILFLKISLAYAIPDVPMWVTEKKARLEFLRREALKKMESKTSGSATSSSTGTGVPGEKLAPRASNARTATPPSSLSRRVAATPSPTSADTCSLILEEESQAVRSHIASSPVSVQSRVVQRHLPAGEGIVGAAGLRGASPVRRSSAGSSVDPPSGVPKKEL